MNSEKENRFQGCLLGMACGDAVGTTLEFKSRGSFEPITDMVGGGPFRLKPGQWTDDTSMALCLAESLTELDRFDPKDQMERYLRWRNDGHWSPTGTCFDIGNTVSSALRTFQQTGEPYSGSTDPYSAGNGCIMRLAPVPMYFHRYPDQIQEMCRNSSRTTHGADECLDASALFGMMIHLALEGASKEACLLEHGVTSLCSPALQDIAAGSYRDKSDSEIKGSGYVVHCLEAALWCFATTETFEKAILRAANLGDDADTTAAVCGQIAGAFYGVEGIPDHWLDRLAMREEIEEMAGKLYLIFYGI